MNPKLFQSAEFYHRRYHNFATLLVLPMSLFVLFLLIFSLIGTKEITVIATGSIRPTEVIEVIQSTSNNTVLTNNLAENKVVAKGDLLIQYSDRLEDSQLNALQTQIERYERQQEALNTLKESLQQGNNLFTADDEFGYSATVENFLSKVQTINEQVAQANNSVAKQEAGISQANDAIASQIESLQTQANHYQEVKNAIQSGATSLSADNPYSATLNSYLSQVQTTLDSQDASSASTTKESIKNQFLTELQGQIDTVNATIASLQTQVASNYSTASYDTSADNQIESLRQQELAQVATQLTQITQEKDNLQVQVEQANLSKEDTILTAGQSGVLHVSDEFEGQNLLPQGSQVAEIYPDITKTQKIAIQYYVDSTHVSQLKEGQKVRLSLEKISNHTITIEGEISDIASSATQTDNGNLFEITAIATVNKQDSSALKYGLQGKVVSVIGKKSFFDYYKDKLLKDMD